MRKATLTIRAGQPDAVMPERDARIPGSWSIVSFRCSSADPVACINGRLARDEARMMHRQNIAFFGKTALLNSFNFGESPRSEAVRRYAPPSLLLFGTGPTVQGRLGDPAVPLLHDTKKSALASLVITS